MWYFAWILGFPVAALVGVLNAMWLEMHAEVPAGEAASDR